MLLFRMLLVSGQTIVSCNNQISSLQCQGQRALHWTVKSVMMVLWDVLIEVGLWSNHYFSGAGVPCRCRTVIFLKTPSSKNTFPTPGSGRHAYFWVKSQLIRSCNAVQQPDLKNHVSPNTSKTPCQKFNVAWLLHHTVQQVIFSCHVHYHACIFASIWYFGSNFVFLLVEKHSAVGLHRFTSDFTRGKKKECWYCVRARCFCVIMHPK